FEVRNDVGYEDMRWITVGPPDQPDTSIVLTPPAVDPGITDDERRTVLEMIAKGTYAMVVLAADDLEAVFAQVEASGAEVVEPPTDQPYGTRDCSVRDPAGNMIKIQQAR
ncbi:MAG: VOC family protein, partial [Acidimicrobiales bacterium]|nr:VOC family protein [Acidimicrobiales bacterium]